MTHLVAALALVLVLALLVLVLAVLARLALLRALRRLALAVLLLLAAAGLGLVVLLRLLRRLEVALRLLLLLRGRADARGLLGLGARAGLLVLLLLLVLVLVGGLVGLARAGNVRHGLGVLQDADVARATTCKFRTQHFNGNKTKCGNKCENMPKRLEIVHNSLKAAGISRCCVKLASHVSLFEEEINTQIESTKKE